MVTTSEAKTANPMDRMMTPAQIARRKFKSSLPRKPQNRRLSALEALGTTFQLLDRFRGIVADEGLDPDTIQAGIVYYLPESDPSIFAGTIPLPKHSELGPFVERVMALDRPLFLGVLFKQDDPATTKASYKTTMFGVQFMGGPEAEGRLLAEKRKQQG